MLLAFAILLVFVSHSITILQLLLRISFSLNVSTAAAGEAEQVKAYDAYVKNTVVPLAQTCDALGMEKVGQLLQDAWEGVRNIVVLASRSKSSPAEELQPHLEPTTKAIGQLRSLRLDRKFDPHQKALMEMVGALSWVFQKPPASLPAGFVKGTLESAQFWSNRIRKDNKEDETQVKFCQLLQKTLQELAVYIEEHHKTGLTWNPKGVSLAEAAIVLADDGNKVQAPPPSPVLKRQQLGTAAAGGGNVAGLLGELSQRKSADGISAATGLRKVTKDQQTWRKEYQKPGNNNIPLTPNLTPAKKEQPKKKPALKKGLPVFEYQDRGYKWVIENQSKEAGVLTVDIGDSKQQVYLYNCEEMSVVVKGKFKSLILDKCVKVSVVFDTLISSTEMVNCRQVKFQVNGVCPSFTIDKTTNVLIWLSQESLDVSTFTTSLSSEMNVNFPSGDDRKELPIPEQFVHRVREGGVTSEVSDLYH